METEVTEITVGKITFTIEHYDPREETLKKRSRDDEETGCLLWTGPLDPDGYGRASVEGRGFAAHRLSYETRVGPIPEGLQLDHTCERRECIRPEHLEPVTNFENWVRHYLRQGVPREEAERLATEDLDRIAEFRKASRYAKETGEGVGIRKGTLVRNGKSPQIWKVVGLSAPKVGAPVVVNLRPANSVTPRPTVKLNRLTVVDL